MGNIRPDQGFAGPAERGKHSSRTAPEIERDIARLSEHVQHQVFLDRPEIPPQGAPVPGFGRRGSAKSAEICGD